MSQSRVEDPIAEVKKLLRCDGVSTLAKYITSAQSFSSFGRSGNYGCTIEDIKFFVKLAQFTTTTYDHWVPPKKLSRYMVQHEINMMRAIRTRIIEPGFTPHFSEILAVVGCDDISRYIDDDKRCQQMMLGKVPRDSHPQSVLCEFRDTIKARAAIDKFALVFSEYCEMPLVDFLDRNMPAFPSEREAIITEFIFQVYFTLACAQRVWPSFRHGDLGMHNLMIKLDIAHLDEMSRGPARYLRYVFDGQEWNLPFRGYYVKIIDFGHGQITEEGIDGVIMRAGDIWVPDHMTFITSLESAMYTRGLMTPAVDRIFNSLNTMRISLVSWAAMYEHRDTFKEPEDALHAHVFSTLEGAVSDDAISRTFTAPDA